jgi:hypothetical protein
MLKYLNSTLFPRQTLCTIDKQAFGQRTTLDSRF